MKCPYIKITTYTRSDKVFVRKENGDLVKTYEDTPCRQNEADTIHEMFTECLKEQCAAWGYMFIRLDNGGSSSCNVPMCLRTNRGAE